MAPSAGRGGQNRKKAKSNKDERRVKRIGSAVIQDIYACSGATETDKPHGNINGKEMVLSSKKVTYLPKSIGTLDWLQVLNLSDCSQLLELPDAIGELKALTELDLKECLSLTKLPATIGELGALTELNLWQCPSLEKLPDAVAAREGLTVVLPDQLNGPLQEDFATLRKLRDDDASGALKN